VATTGLARKDAKAQRNHNHVCFAPSRGKLAPGHFESGGQSH
jgi:predicted DNA-binding protein with PD1-like motif